MKLLLDTHFFLGYGERTSLESLVARFLGDSMNEIYLSAISANRLF